MASLAQPEPVPNSGVSRTHNRATDLTADFVPHNVATTVWLRALIWFAFFRVRRLAMTKIRIVGLGGSFNLHSSSRATIANILSGARDAGAEVENLDVRELALPLYDYETETPTAVQRFIDAVRSAHGMVWCSPLYHGSVSGAFKNTLDWLQLLSRDDPPYLTGKVIALAATAGGDQPLQAINTMEYIVRALRGWTLPLTAPVSRADAAFDDNGTPRSENLARRLDAVGRELVEAARLFAQRGGPKAG